MIDVKDLKVCFDCGTVYPDKFFRKICLNYPTNNFEHVSSDSDMGSLERVF
jgi:predicted  nucleic acid-binding Zn-ribbon protein